MRPIYQGFALRWVKGWAFGPDHFPNFCADEIAGDRLFFPARFLFCACPGLWDGQSRVIGLDCNVAQCQHAKSWTAGMKLDHVEAASAVLGPSFRTGHLRYMIDVLRSALRLAALGGETEGRSDRFVIAGYRTRRKRRA